MSRYYLFSWALLCLPLHTTTAAEVTSARSGVWGSSSTWVGGRAPGPGDTVAIRDGHVITVRGEVSVGASGPQNSTAIDLHCSGQLEATEGAVIRVRGDVTFASGCEAWAVRLRAGSSWVFDSSGSASLRTTRYRFGGNAENQLRPFLVEGSESRRVRVTSNVDGGALPGYFNPNREGSGDFVYGAPVVASYADFSLLGGANLPAIAFGFSPNSANRTVEVRQSTFDRCGPVTSIANIGPGMTLIWDGNLHSNTLSTPLLLNFVGSADSGARRITWNIFDTAIQGVGYTQYELADTQLTDNYFGGGVSASIGQPVPWRQFARNFVRLNGATLPVLGDVSDSYFAYDKAGDNPHFTQLSGRFGSAIRKNVFESADDVVTDSGEVVASIYGVPAAPTHYSITGNILLPSKTGHSTAEIVSIAAGPPNVFVSVEHNTWSGGTAIGAFPMVMTDETGNNQPEQYSSIRSNLLWSAAGAPFYKVLDIGNWNTGTPQQNVAAPSAADNNASGAGLLAAAACPNCSTYSNQGNGYAGNWFATPGAHDVNGIDPGFADSSRNVATFDSAYLGNLPGTQWVATLKPTAGMTVWDSQPGVYASRRINYRYHDGPACGGANPRPGSAANWTDCWEWSTLHRLREGVASRQTIDDASIGADQASLVTALILWVRAGFAPTAPQLRGAAHDGTDIGAVPSAPSASQPPRPRRR